MLKCLIHKTNSFGYDKQVLWIKYCSLTILWVDCQAYMHRPNVQFIWLNLSKTNTWYANAKIIQKAFVGNAQVFML